MNCFLYQLRFNTAVHFGGSESALSLYTSEDFFRADTLFSALCHTALQLHGERGLTRLLELAKNGELVLSDAMPWAGERYYLPKPYYAAQTARELPAEKRKAMKKLTWLPAERYDEYCQSLRTGEWFECEAVSTGTYSESTKAMVQEEGDALPYPVGLYWFRENCGLYFLAMLAEERDRAWLSELVSVLGVSGIGGKVSSGYGRFSVVKEQDLSRTQDPGESCLYEALTRTGSHSVLLTTALPREEELEAALDGAGYRLVRRAGFVASNTYADGPRKKQTQYYLSAGSVLSNRFSGDVYQVGVGGTHPVYRYGKPMFLGVEL